MNVIYSKDDLKDSISQNNISGNVIVLDYFGVLDEIEDDDNDHENFIADQINKNQATFYLIGDADTINLKNKSSKVELFGENVLQDSKGKVNNIMGLLQTSNVIYYDNDGKVLSNTIARRVTSRTSDLLKTYLVFLSQDYATMKDSDHKFAENQNNYLDYLIDVNKLHRGVVSVESPSTNNNNNNKKEDVFTIQTDFVWREYDLKTQRYIEKSNPTNDEIELSNEFVSKLTFDTFMNLLSRSTTGSESMKKMKMYFRENNLFFMNKEHASKLVDGYKKASKEYNVYLIPNQD